MPETVFGLPVHPLVVHATVVLVPLAALLLVLSALLPRVRRWAGVLTPVVAIVALVLVPLSTSSGENLEEQVAESSLIEQHSEYADGMLPWMIGVAVLAVASYWLDRRARVYGSADPANRRTGLALAVTVLSVVAFLGTTVQVVLVGHSGAEAAWSDTGRSSARTQSGDGD
ncbi:MAG: DUF2231 domain-containing protein [Nocardioidaceae bacterium]